MKNSGTRKEFYIELLKKSVSKELANWETTLSNFKSDNMVLPFKMIEDDHYCVLK